jgi:tetratricopeptide (TPR) repeat protein
MSDSTADLIAPVSEDELDNALRVLSSTLPVGPPPRGASRPAVIPGYEILGELGHGGYALVYLARETGGEQRQVALKVLRSELRGERDPRRRFQTEIEVLRQLKHPGIVELYDAGETEGQPWYTMAWHPRTLAQAWQADPPPGEVVRLVEELARTMQFAHEQGVLHRDLKPSNVLLSPDGAPRIADFNTALVLDRRGYTLTNQILGSLSYLSPEQALGKNRAGVDPRTDVYSLGAILYEGFTGRPPFLGATDLETLRQVEKEEPIPPRRLVPTLSRELELICLTCLHKEPYRRYISMAELAAELRRVRQNEPIRQKPVGTPERVLVWCHRNPTLAWLGAFILLLLVLVAVVGTWGGWQARERAAQAETLAATALEREKEAEGRARAERENRLQEVRQQGNLAARTGSWDKARELALRLLPDVAAEEQAQLRVRAARASLFLDDPAEAGRQLDFVSPDPPGSVIGLWRFERAVLLLDQSMRRLFRERSFGPDHFTPEEKEALVLLEAVVRDPRVPEADRITAAGIRACTAPEAMACFDRALEIEPFHPHALVLAVTLDMAAGRVESALARAEVWQRLSPADPNPVLHRAILLMLRKRYPEAEATLERLRKRMPAKFGPTIDAHRFVIDAHHVIQDLLDEGVSPTLDTLTRVVRLLGPRWDPFGQEGAGAYRLAYTPAQRLEFTRYLEITWAQMVAVSPAVRLLWPRKALPAPEALRLADRITGFAPAGTLAFQRAVLRATMLWAAQREKSPKAVELRAATAADLTAALDGPGYFDVRRLALLSLANWKLHLQTPGPLDQRQREARLYLRSLLGQGEVSRGLAKMALPLAQKADDTELVRDLTVFLNDKTGKPWKNPR